MAMLHILKQYYRNNITNRSLYFSIWKFFFIINNTYPIILSIPILIPLQQPK